MEAWIRVLTAEEERDGEGELFFKQKKRVLMMRFVWCSNYRLVSKIAIKL